MSRTIHVMVVDDTDHVRRMLTSMLSLDGYEVVGDVATTTRCRAWTGSTPPAASASAGPTR